MFAARATLELRRGHLEKALALFDLSVKANPFDHWNRYQRMLIFTRLGRKAEADAEHQAVEKIKAEQDRFAEISRELLKNPLDSQLRSKAARWLMEHGHEDEAVDWANLVLQSDPAHLAMNRLLADFYRKKGQLGLANFYDAQAPGPSSNAVEPLTTEPLTTVNLFESLNHE